MPDSRNLEGVGVPPLVAELLGSVPVVVAGTGTTQAAAAPIQTKNVLVNAQASQTAVYLPTATGSPVSSKILWGQIYLVNSTLSAASPIIFVGLGGFMNGVLNGSITLAAGQAAIAWQQAPGVYYTVKTN